MTIWYISFDVSLHYFVYLIDCHMCKTDPKSQKMQNKAYPVPCHWNENYDCIYDEYDNGGPLLNMGSNKEGLPGQK